MRRRWARAPHNAVKGPCSPRPADPPVTHTRCSDRVQQGARGPFGAPLHPRSRAVLGSRALFNSIWATSVHLGRRFPSTPERALGKADPRRTAPLTGGSAPALDIISRSVLRNAIAVDARTQGRPGRALPPALGSALALACLRITRTRTGKSGDSPRPLQPVKALWLRSPGPLRPAALSAIGERYDAAHACWGEGT